MRGNATTEHDTKKKDSFAKTAAHKMTTSLFSPKIKAKIMAKWSKINEGDVDAMNGSFEMLASKIQEIYSYPKVKAERECEEFKRSNKLQ
jgi:uncharacterized protein YjbJ (UPF0337 family)